MQTETTTLDGFPAWLADFNSTFEDGQRQVTDNDRLAAFRKFAEHGGLETSEPILPLLLNLKGKPYTLKDHFPFSPAFRTRKPKEMAIKAARQVSKSTSLAAEGIVFSNSVPNRTTLYITPLFEQIRRFSSNYVGDFINQSPVKSLWSDTSTNNSVLQRSFRNFSKMIFSFALVDADRTRGISADRISFDESYHKDTLIDVLVGDSVEKREICRLQSGDLVLSYDHQGKLLWAPVSAVSHHGWRAGFKFTTRQGHHVIATSDTHLATDRGWRRVAQIIDLLEVRDDAAGGDRQGLGARVTVNDPDPTRHGDDARRRIDEPAVEACEVREQPRLEPGYVQLDEVHRLVRVRRDSSVKAEERRLRGLLEQVHHGDAPGVRLLVRPDVSGREEAGDVRLAGRDRRGRVSTVSGLVDGRRRLTTGDGLESGAHSQHARFLLAGGWTPGRVVDGPRLPVDLEPGSEARWEEVPHHPGRHRRHLEDAGGPAAVRGAAGQVQGRTYRTTGDDDLRLLQTGVPGDHRADPASPGDPVLWQRGVSAGEAPDRIQEVQRGPGKTQEAPGTEPGGLLRRPGILTRGRASTPGRLPTCKSRSGQSGKVQVPGEEASREACEALDVSRLRLDRAARGQGLEDQVLSDLQGRRRGDDQAEESGQSPWLPELRSGDGTPQFLEVDDIVAIEYVGTVEVYDITVEGTHTFCPGGIGGSNCQDISFDLIPIILESMSYSPWAIATYSGTPKTLDGPMEVIWRESSQAEWIIPCPHCTENGKPTENVPSLDYHLIDMIGPYRDDISEANPGTICHRCRQPISPRAGRWRHRYKERRWRTPGYHVPQIIMPEHYSKPDKWETLLGKQSHMSEGTFYNEVCGESFDAGSKLVTLTDLQAAAVLPWDNKDEPDPEVLERLKHYDLIVLGIDWGGGRRVMGKEETSFTSLALVGVRTDGHLDVLWGRRLKTPHDHVREAKQVRDALRKFQPHIIAHDYTGAGDLRETILVQGGAPPEQIMRMYYVGAARKNVLTYKPPSVVNPRAHYQLDKGRSIQYTTHALKLGLISTFRYDYKNKDMPGLLHDFLALTDEKAESSAGDIYKIGRQAGFPDDFAHAVNFACCAVWNARGAWPDFAALVGDFGLGSARLAAAIGLPEDDWSAGVGGYFAHP